MHDGICYPIKNLSNVIKHIQKLLQNATIGALHPGPHCMATLTVDVAPQLTCCCEEPSWNQRLLSPACCIPLHPFCNQWSTWISVCRRYWCLYRSCRTTNTVTQFLVAVIRQFSETVPVVSLLNKPLWMAGMSALSLDTMTRWWSMRNCLESEKMLSTGGYILWQSHDMLGWQRFR